MAVLDASRPGGFRFARRIPSCVVFVVALLIFIGLFTIEGVVQASQPSNFAIASGDGQLILTWGPNPGWTKTVKHYEYASSHNTNWTDGTASQTVTITGLTNGTSYNAQVRAEFTDNSHGVPTQALSETPNIAAPTGLSATAGDGEVTLSWTASANWTTTQSSDTYYKYYQDDGNTNTWTQVPSSTKTTATYTVTGLDNGTTYTFKVRAHGAGGDGKESNSDTATPMLSPPAAPTPFSATPGDGRVTLNWTAPSGPITRYEYNQKEGNQNYAGWTSTGSTNTSYIVTGLTNGQTYTFKVRAVNSAGDGAESVERQVTPDASAPPPPPPPPPVDINAGTTQTLTVQRVNSRTVTLSWDIPTALNPQTIAYEYSTNGGQTWTSTNSTNTSITITGDGFGDLPTTQFKIRAMNQNTDGTESFVIISASATQQRRILLRPRECPLGWTRGSVFGNTKKALIYELKVEADPTNTASIYQLKSLAIYVHPNEGLETLDGWTLKVGTLYNQFGKEFKLTAENSVIDEYDFAHIENPEETPIPMGMLGYIGQSLPSFDYRLYDAGGVRVDFGISCYKGGGLTWRLWNTADPRLLRVLPLEKSEAALSVQMENLDWQTPFFRSEWTAAIMPDLPDAPAAPSQIKGNIVGTWGDLKKR